MTKQPVAVVTGGSAGIGKAVGNRLRAEGYRVVSLSRQGGEYRADVSDPVAVDAAAAQVLADTGGVDALVTCAGIVGREHLADASPEHIARQVGVNLMGTMHACRAFSAALTESRGTIVTMSSSIAASPQHGTSAYAAAKGGVEAFTKALALELAPGGVRVNAVRPALVESRIWINAGMDPKKYRALLEQRAAEYPLGRVGQPEDIAAAVAFLVSAEAAWITGIVLPVDGGGGLVGK
ncbi:SDR family oxidoreductase [Haloactinopolyspora sp.]|uniref:SDR family NAD(P)-dependent oxidoreductase n=1 Tax=Haloactinopolyspora sp. TaxID=1966353 RepID=UPI00260E9546|nr:SDR family oxidoreductase [Haloactinopolyspora sp.]